MKTPPQAAPSAFGSPVMTEAKLRELVEFAAPQDGAFRFRVFPIPPKAAALEMNVDGEKTRIPLRSEEFDLRCGLAVGDRDGSPAYVTAIEMSSVLPFSQIEQNVADCYAAIMRELKRDGR